MSKIYEITITVDTNDGDYNTETNKITEEELNKIRPLITSIKNFKPYKVKAKGINWTHSHNYPYGECLREDLKEKSPEELYKYDESIHCLFENLLPGSEYGFHSIESITVCPFIDKEILL